MIGKGKIMVIIDISCVFECKSYLKVTIITCTHVYYILILVLITEYQHLVYKCGASVYFVDECFVMFPQTCRCFHSCL